MGGTPLDWAKEGSGFRVQGCGGGFAANIYGAMPESGGDSDTGETHFQHTGKPTPSRCARQPLPEEGTRMWGVRVYRSLLPLEGGARRAEIGAQSGVKDDVRLSIFLGKQGRL